MPFWLFCQERKKFLVVVNQKFKETDSINSVLVSEVSSFVGNPVYDRRALLYRLAEEPVRWPGLDYL